MTDSTKPITIYKASAGSGKTFTLAVEYIKLLVLNPQNYRNILAVTFTNKATEEMKTRILGQLYGIGNALPDSEDYMDCMRQAFPKMGDTMIRQRAKEALDLVLHNYHYFKVGTIDSFFQRILRNLARELGLTANLTVALNDSEVEERAVDNIIENISGDDDPLLTWVMDFVTEKIDDEKNWNVIGQIKNFGKNIFKDFYKEHQRELRRIMDDPEFFKRYTNKLRTMRAEANKTMEALAAEYRKIVDERLITDKDFFQGGKGVPGYYAKIAAGNFTDDKMPNSYVAKAIEDPICLVRKGTENNPTSQVIISEIGPLLRRTEEERERQSVVVRSVDLTLGNINELRLLGRIEREVRRINADNNNYPLSNTQKLLNDLIDKQDSPFIYEKIGARLRYIMIDEFQDTSTVQWSNFKVLLDDCLAHNNGSLIVGDVKQSIYRWRNGDWHLLQNLTPENDSRIEIKTLSTNYRSKRNIIQFNNVFFKIASRLSTDDAIATLELGDAPSPLMLEAQDIARAYGDVVQRVSAKEAQMDESAAGSVTIRLIPAKEYETQMIMEVGHTLEELLSTGIRPGKIAILARNRKHIRMLANYFQQNAIELNGEPTMVPMVSDEAFRLGASLAVNTIVRAMRLLANPNDKLTAAALVKAYRKIKGNAELVPDSEMFAGKNELSEQLPQEMKRRWDELLSTPLVDLAEKLYHIFNLEELEGQSAYVCAFFDKLSDFAQEYVAGIDDFLKEWDENIADKSIQSDEVDGVRLLTIHKSKGLEFENVIIPFCDWKTEMSTDVLWVAPKHAPYNELPLVPVNFYTNKLMGSIYREQYQSEHLKNLVDNLNLLYVAFTRAGCNLFVFGKKGRAEYPSTLIGKVLEFEGPNPLEKNDADKDGPRVKLADILPGHTLENGEDDVTTFQFGTLCPAREEKTKATSNVFEQAEQGVRIPVRNYDTKAIFRQSNDSVNFVTPQDDLDENERRQSYIQTGNILHALLASIVTADDVSEAIDKLEFDGVLYGKPMTRQKLKAMIDDRLSKPEVARWFTPEWQVLNERDILSYDKSNGNVKKNRPDRVIYNKEEMIVIDFKTGKEMSRHHAQVRGYMALLREMGYGNVSGYLWYIEPNRTVRVEPGQGNEV